MTHDTDRQKHPRRTEQPAPRSSNPSLEEASNVDLERRWNEQGDTLARDILAIRKWRDGDADAGLTLLEEYEAYFYRVCTRFGVRETAELEDVYQEVVLDLSEHLHELAERITKSFAGFYAWRIRNAITRVRKRSSPQGVSLDDSATMPPVDDETPEPRLAAWESIERCWHKLPDREHRVFELRFLQEMTLAEIAACLESNVNAVSQAIFRLSRKMKDCLTRAGYAA